MRINEIYSRDLDPDERFSKAMQDAELRGPGGQSITFLELPTIVQHKILASRSYEDVAAVREMPRSEIKRPIVGAGDKVWYIISYNDGYEEAFWPDSTEVETKDEEEHVDPETLEFHMQTHYGESPPSSVHDAMMILQRPGMHITNRSQAEYRAEDLWFNINAAREQFETRKEFAKAVGDYWDKMV